MQVTDIRLSDIAQLSFLDFRTELEDWELEGLMGSIERYGLVQPVVVRRSRESFFQMNERPMFELVCGSRRCAAFRKLGLERIPAVVMELGDREAFEVSLIENVQHENLNPIEEGEAFKSYVTSFGRGSVTKLAERIGKSEEYVSHRLLLLGLPKALQERISRRLLNPSHATELVWLKNPATQLEVSEAIAKNHLSLRQVRTVAKMLKRGDIEVKEAVARVLKSHGTGGTGIPRAGNGLEPWSNSASESDAGPDRNTRSLNQMKLVMRTALADLDLLAEKTDRSFPIYGFLIAQRRATHAILDEIIRTEVEYRKRGVLAVSA